MAVELFPDAGDFYQEFLSGFEIDGKLVGVPVIVSPWCMLCNRELFARAGVELPKREWSWDEFYQTIVRLGDALGNNRAFSWSYGPTDVMNFVAAARGAIFAPDALDPVRIDAPETVRALTFHAMVRRLPGACATNGSFLPFGAGECAMMLSPRQNMAKMRREKPLDLCVVNVPVPPGGARAPMLAADLFCLRKNSADDRLAKNVLKLLLSRRTKCRRSAPILAA